MYGQALRTLTRAARRGDANAALKTIDVGNDAMSRGFSPGGIRDAEGFKAEANQFEADMAQGAADMGQRERLDRRFAGSTLSREPVNPNATPLGQTGNALSPRGTVNPNATPGAAPLTEEQKRRRLTMGGAFGSGARDKLLSRTEAAAKASPKSPAPVNPWWDNTFNT